MNIRQKVLLFLLLTLVSTKVMASTPVVKETDPGGKPADAEATVGFIVGQVLTAEGTPAENSQVSTHEKDPQGLADKQGRFRISGVEPGLHTIWARHAFLGRASQVIEIVPGENHVDLTLVPEEKRKLRGRVVDSDGKPVELAMVEASTSEEGISMYSRKDGSFFMDIGLEGDFKLLARKEGYAPGRLDSSSLGGALEGLEIRLGKMAMISGRILGVEPPEELSWVKLLAFDENMNVWGTVDPDGSFRIPGVGPGEWKVQAQLGNRFASADVVILPKEELLTDLELVIPAEKQP